MTATTQAPAFEVGREFVAGQGGGGLDLGPHAEQYGELFADALDDGVITAEERERLDRAADNLGLDRGRLRALEQAMIAAHEAHHRVRVVEKWQESLPPPPLETDPAGASAAGAGLAAEVARLQARIRELEAELREARSHVNVEVDLSGFEPSPVSEEPIDRLRARIARDPLNPDLFSALHQACDREGDADAKHRAAEALVALDAASPEQQRSVNAHREHCSIAPRRSLGAEDWIDSLSHPDLGVVTSNVLSLVTPAALVGRAATLHQAGQLPALDAADRQDPETTTVTAVRAIGWAAKILGLKAPIVHAQPSLDVGHVHVPAMPPCSLLGRGALSGRSPAEHAFSAGRHVSYYRADLFARVIFPDVKELEDLFLAALCLGNPDLALPAGVKRVVEPLSRALSPLIEPSRCDELRRQYKAFVADGAKTNLLAWSEAADKSAARAGLLLCNDLVSARAVLEREEGARGPLFSDLLGYSASPGYSLLRRELGIAAS